VHQNETAPRTGGRQCKMAGTGFHSVVASRAQMCTTDCGKPWYLDLRLPRRKYSYRGLPQPRFLIWERIAKGLFLLWQTAVPLRAVCQGVIPVLANRGIWTQNATNDWIPVPSILHRQFPSLLRHKFLPRDFPGVKPLHSELIRPKLHKNGLS
jgi:hypothetical protein